MSLENHVKSNNPQAILIQDMPKLKLHDLELNCQIIAPNYRQFFLMPIEDQGNKLHIHGITLVRDNIAAQLIEPDNEYRSQLDSIESTVLGVLMTTETGKKVPLYNVYVKPKSTHKETSLILDWIYKSAAPNWSKIVVAGDFNASSPQWDRPRFGFSLDGRHTKIRAVLSLKYTRGRAITRFMKMAKLQCLNRFESGPTYSKRAGESSHVDLILVGAKSFSIWNSFSIEKLEGKTGHRIVLAKTRDLERKVKLVQRIEVSRMKRTNFLFIRCLGLERICSGWTTKPSAQIKDRMNFISDILYKQLLDVQQAVTVCRPLGDKRFIGYTRSMRNLLSKLESCQQRVYLLRRKKMFYRTKKLGLDLKDDQELVKQMNLLRRLRGNLMYSLDLDAKMSFSSYSNDESDEIGNVDMMEASDEDEFEGSHINEARYGAVSIQDPIERFVEVKFPFKQRNNINLVEREFVRDPSIQMPVVIEDQEIAVAMNTLAKKSGHGHEGLKFSVFAESYESIKLFINTICKMSFYISEIPNCCKTSLGTLIPKSSKPNDYRIVHQSTPLAALLEQIALHRLQHTFEIIGAYNPRQYAFTKNRDRLDLLTRIIENIFTHRNLLKKTKDTFCATTLIKLDIRGAFDNVDHDVLSDRLMEELKPNPLRFWLVRFLLDRRIVVEHDGFRTKARPICTGVPQGSSLGPILWNYTINKIDEGMLDHGVQEVLAYADDLFILRNGTIVRKVQETLNLLVERLKAINLSISNTKTEFMVIKVGNTKAKFDGLTIEGERIREVDKINILGVIIKKNLKLEPKFIPRHCEVALAPGIRKLYTLCQLNITKSSTEWHALINEHIVNKLYSNFHPILAIHKPSRDAIDGVFVKAMRMIFNWSQNTSADLIKLIMGFDSSSMLVRTWIEGKISGGSDHLHGYQLLLDKLDSKLGSNCLSSLTLNNGRRQHFDPSIIIDKPKSWTQDYRPIWIIVEREKTSIALQLIGDILCDSRSAHHADRRIVYFNTFALLHNMFEDKSICGTDILMRDSSTILQAILNAHNTDWRVLELRERMVKSGWRVFVAPNNVLDSLKRDVYNLCGDYIGSLESTPLLEPPLNDYKAREVVKLATRKSRKLNLYTCHTKVAEALSPNPEVWQKINPAHISTMNLMRLAGLIGSEDGSFKSGSLEPGIMPEGCKDTRCQENNRGHTLLHRMFDCPRYEGQRASFKESLGRKHYNFEHIIQRYGLRKKLFSFMEACSTDLFDPVSETLNST